VALNAIEAALLGVVQGLTEFFPVSSSGHLALFQTLFGGRDGGALIFEVSVHVATLIAIIAFYRDRIRALIVGFFTWNREAVDYVGKLVVGTVPSVIVGLTAKDWIETQFSNPVLVGCALLVTGAIVFTTRWTAARAVAASPGWAIAVAIGLAQAFAILPGISRSGSTVAVALALGVAPRPAAEFSFLLGIIAISGAAVLMLPGLSEVEPDKLLNIGIGSLTALMSGLVAIWLFVRMLDRSLFHYWAWYCWAVGGAFLVWSLA
jgi:undecaprenyl-diphosphatase